MGQRKSQMYDFIQASGNFASRQVTLWIYDGKEQFREIFTQIGRLQIWYYHRIYKYSVDS